MTASVRSTIAMALALRRASSRHTALPMPLAAPLTTATLSFISMPTSLMSHSGRAALRQAHSSADLVRRNTIVWDGTDCDRDWPPVGAMEPHGVHGQAIARQRE